MSYFEYVRKNETNTAREEIEEIIKEVQDLLRDDFTFQFHIIGSAKRKMITREVNGNRGFDFDYDLEPNCNAGKYTAKQIKDKFRNAIDKAARKHNYKPAEDSTRVITIKQFDYIPLVSGNRIYNSCDFAIVRYVNGQKQYLHNDKFGSAYLWEPFPDEYMNLERKAEIIRKNGKWMDVRNMYLNLKSNNSNPVALIVYCGTQGVIS